MNDLISRQAAIDSTKELFKMGDCYCDEYSIVGMLNQLPSAQKKGTWILHHEPFTWMGFAYWTCSECGYESKITNFCSNCGADMKGKR